MLPRNPAGSLDNSDICLLRSSNSTFKSAFHLQHKMSIRINRHDFIIRFLIRRGINTDTVVHGHGEAVIKLVPYFSVLHNLPIVSIKA
jgi:hypothetical protein